MEERKKPSDAPVPEISPGVLQGYLAKEGLPDSAALLPPPPALGSAGLALDQEVGRTALAMHNSPRWKLAAMDADLTFPNAAGTFSCVLGAPVTEQDTPHLYQMLRRVLTDAGLATYAAKDKYQHARPFMLNDQPICTPDKDKSLRMQGSYPSGHASAGWAWALVLAEASPGQRGRTNAHCANVGAGSEKLMFPRDREHGRRVLVPANV